jgi:hypothetical protein
MRKARPSKPAAPKVLSLDKALDAMRVGGTLVELHLPVNEGGTAWYIAPAGGRVTSVTATKLIERENVQPANDGMFGSSQTYRLKSR